MVDDLIQQDGVYLPTRGILETLAVEHAAGSPYCANAYAGFSSELFRVNTRRAISRAPPLLRAAARTSWKWKLPLYVYGYVPTARSRLGSDAHSAVLSTPLGYEEASPSLH